MKKNIESKAADTILENPKEVTIGTKTYKVAPPTVRTLIEASKLISQLPAIKMDTGSVLLESLAIAKDCEILGKILAVLVIGAKTEQQDRGGMVLWRKKKTDPVKQLADELLDTISPTDLKDAIAQILKAMEIADFFAITASLLEISLLGATRETETTASGLS